ncbi:hypothetical protein AB2B38_003170 [Balneola sp. MJW-20]|uniref:hypothetical protein n=1 Tax=Gracilimonas aurantiaca TaxID=3234185 RepID=UPI0034679C43
MKRSIFTVLFLVLAFNHGYTQNVDSLREAYIENRNIPDSWNMELFEEDVMGLDKRNERLPFKDGAFPTPYYNRSQPDYNGLSNMMMPGVQGLYKEIDGQRILYNSVSIGKNSLNADHLGERKDDLFFQIVVLTDFIDDTTYTHLGSQLYSRNHPDYLFQGYFKTSVETVEYLAFQTATGSGFAVINMRLFDLSKGKTILIAPHTDGSLRSMQISSPPLSSATVDGYTDELIRDPKVVEFFTAPGVITWENQQD